MTFSLHSTSISWILEPILQGLISSIIYSNIIWFKRKNVFWTHLHSDAGVLTRYKNCNVSALSFRPQIILQCMLDRTKKKISLAIFSYITKMSSKQCKQSFSIQGLFQTELKPWNLSCIHCHQEPKISLGNSAISVFVYMSWLKCTGG